MMAVKPTKTAAKKLLTKAGATAAAKGLGKRLVPGASIAFAADSARKGRWADAASEISWLTVPTGIGYKLITSSAEMTKNTPMPKGAKIRYGLGTNVGPKKRGK